MLLHILSDGKISVEGIKVTEFTWDRILGEINLNCLIKKKKGHYAECIER